MFPYNILLNIKSGITPVKSRDSATLFLFNCRRWDCNIWEENVHQQLQKEAALRDNLFVHFYNPPIRIFKIRFHILECV